MVVSMVNANLPIFALVRSVGKVQDAIFVFLCLVVNMEIALINLNATVNLIGKEHFATYVSYENPQLELSPRALRWFSMVLNRNKLSRFPGVQF